ncbi:hypothetical protein PFISCL1PPCAC_27308, partial [Pristionchus fissidentatus]
LMMARFALLLVTTLTVVSAYPGISDPVNGKDPFDRSQFEKAARDGYLAGVKVAAKLAAQEKAAADAARRAAEEANDRAAAQAAIEADKRAALQAELEAAERALADVGEAEAANVAKANEVEEVNGGTTTAHETMETSTLGEIIIDNNQATANSTELIETATTTEDMDHTMLNASHVGPANATEEASNNTSSWTPTTQSAMVAQNVTSDSIKLSNAGKGVKDIDIELDMPNMRLRIRVTSGNSIVSGSADISGLENEKENN